MEVKPFLERLVAGTYDLWLVRFLLCLSLATVALAFAVADELDQLWLCALVAFSAYLVGSTGETLSAWKKERRKRT